MNADAIDALPARPESVAAWEDLLVRLEIVPRVVRNAVDEVVDHPAAVRTLADASAREEQVGGWLEAASRTEEHGRRRGSTVYSSGDAAGLAFRFASLRARTFAMVQRRGLEVWEWEGPLKSQTSVTVYQLLFWLARRDADLLADLRDSTRARVAGC